MSTEALLVGVQVGALILVPIVGAATEREKQVSRPPAPTVVFVCQHGNVKSLIASQWFNRLAAERGLAVRAVSRGVTPETPVPPAIAERLARDGFDVTRFEPTAFTPADLGASRVVMIGVEPPAWVGSKRLGVETWDRIPPATERYEASRDAMRDRIGSMLDALAKRMP
jgi:arsenate reductase